MFRDRYAVGEGGPGLGECGYEGRVATGEVLLGEECWVDGEGVNRDPFKRPSKVARWREEFAKIGRELE